MSDPISAVKVLAGGLAAGAAVPALADAASKAEQLAPIVGVSWSVLLVAIAGALTVVDLNGRVSASYTLRAQVAANGQIYAAGMGLGVEQQADGTYQTQVLFRADRFAFINVANGVLSAPFVRALASETSGKTPKAKSLSWPA